jgi:UPF0271 protein
MRAIDLNVDLGEGCPWDDALLALATSASICCGRHAGGRRETVQALEAAKRLGVTVGAHPGYDDREHFGRRPLTISSPDVAALVREKLEDLIGWSDRAGVSVRFVKPHGALYNQAQSEREIASGVLDGVRPFGLPVVGLPTGILGRLVRDAGLRFVPEGFADRRYDASGQLVPRSRPDAVLTEPEEIERQLGRLVAGGEIQTVCVHGDHENAVVAATSVRRALDRIGAQVRGFV